MLNFYKQYPKPVVDGTQNNFMKLLNPNSYQKGAWVLHMLRNKLGDEVFWKGIKTYYNKYKFANASTTDFKKVMQEVSGKNLIIYPNPATSMARIKFISQDKGIIKLTAWSSEGKLIHSIADQEYTAGEHILNWNLSMIPKGIYFIKLEGNLNSENSRCIVVK